MKSFLVYRLQWEVQYIQAIPGSTIYFFVVVVVFRVILFEP